DGMPLTPVAGYDGKVIAANVLTGNQVKTEYDAIPTVVFTIPPLASVGMAEETAKRNGLRFRRNHMEIGGWYSSRRVGERAAAFKVVVGGGWGRRLGASMLVKEAGETSEQFALAMRKAITASDLKQVLFAYPTHASDVQYMA